jgi:hypothetical protein
MSKIFLAVPFEFKEKAKELGAKWDKETKQWFIPEKSLLSNIATWIPPTTIEKVVVREPSQEEIIELFNALPSRFKTGREVCESLGLDIGLAMRTHSQVCLTCDSTITDEYSFGRACLSHYLEGKRISPKERAQLESYLLYVKLLKA